MNISDIKKLLENQSELVMDKIITDLIADNSVRAIKMQQLYNNFSGEVPIKLRKFDDDTKVNSKLPNDYRGVITDTKVGYFLGHPIGYTYEGDDKITEEIKSFNSRNSVSDLDATTGEFMSVCGVGARLLYIDTEGRERAMNIKPWEVAFVYDSTLDELQYAMIYYPVTEDNAGIKSTYTRVEWYDKQNVTFYRSDVNSNYYLDPLEPVNPTPHLFDFVPVVKFQNNNLEKGDYEKVEELIDAYDRNLSDVQNEVEEYRLAYMAFYGVEPSKEDMKKFRETGGISFPENTNADFITKDLNGAVQFVENHKKTLDENIMKFSKCVNMNDEKFSGGAQTGESRKWKLLSMENDAISKERKYVKALQYQFKVLSSALSKKGIQLDSEKMSFTFKRNLPAELLYEAELSVKLKGQVTERTRLGVLSIVKDVEAELAEMKQEQDEASARLLDENGANMIVDMNE